MKIFRGNKWLLLRVVGWWRNGRFQKTCQLLDRGKVMLGAAFATFQRSAPRRIRAVPPEAQQKNLVQLIVNRFHRCLLLDLSGLLQLQPIYGEVT